MNYHTIEEALDALRAGKCILVTDDPDRENEGDLCRTICHHGKCQPHGICCKGFDLYANECRKCGTVGFIANGTA